MHQWSLPELQGVSTRRTTRALRSSRPRRGSVRWCPCPPRGAPLWAWLLLGALVVPGAWSFLSEEQEELLVELHNYYRGQVSPSALAMLPLRWDPSLKVIAEGYASKCVWNHNPELEDTGENLFAGTGPLDLRVALEKWFLEHLDYDFHNNSCDEDKMCGHYTQMVWADTHRVGCAFHLCNIMEGLDWERVSYLVCNYYPAGNYEGERPYVEGDWCSNCPENLQKCENNLCVADTVEEEVEDEEDEEEVEDEEEGTVFPPPDTPSPAFQPEEEEEEEEEEVFPPPATTEPYVQPEEEEEEEEEEEVVPPPATTEPYVQPEEEEEEEEEEVVPPPYVQPATTTSTPSITTTSSTWDSEDEDARPPTTPAPGTHPPKAPSTTLGEEEKVEEELGEERVEKVEEELGEERVEKVEAETTDKMEGKNRDVTRKIYDKKTVRTVSAGSVSSPSLLLAGLTGILTLRL